MNVLQKSLLKYLAFLAVLMLLIFFSYYIFIYLLKNSPTLRKFTREVYSEILGAQEKQSFKEGEIIVKFDDEITSKEALTLVKAMGVSARDKNAGDVFYFSGAAYVISDQPVTEELLQNLLNHEGITKAKENWTVANGIILNTADDTPRSKIKEVAESFGLTLYDYNRTAKLDVYVPVGKEQQYSNIFLMHKDDGVNDAHRLQLIKMIDF